MSVPQMLLRAGWYEAGDPDTPLGRAYGECCVYAKTKKPQIMNGFNKFERKFRLLLIESCDARVGAAAAACSGAVSLPIALVPPTLL